MLKTLRWLALVPLLAGCLGMPEKVTPVTGFDGERYMGKWYEVARIDNRFEEGLSKVTAEYRLNENGKITVINRGFSEQENQWQQAEGKAYFVQDKDTAYLKVSFFGPFYGSYVVFNLDKNYQYAFVSGADTDYLWLLARTPDVDQSVKAAFLAQAQQRGFDQDRIIWVEQ